MKTPRNVSASDLTKALKKFGYVQTRQTGSHIQMTTKKNGEHHVTVPNHDPVKIGTLSSILNDVAEHFQKSKEEIAKELFG